MAGSRATAASKGRGAVGGGRVMMWRGGSLWVSQHTGPAQRHAHHAIQITLAPQQPVRLRSEDSDPWLATQACIVMPDKFHQFDGCGQDVAMVFVEPETTAGRMLLARYAHSPLTSIADEALIAESRRLLDGLANKAGDDVMIAAAQTIIRRLAGDIPEASGVDPRITRALEWIRNHLNARITLAKAASVAHLSPGRFRHLFVAQTGISFRAYVLWARVNAAMVTAMAGQSWTEAAQHSGFADSAHFTRTCKRMFGISPSMLDREK